MPPVSGLPAIQKYPNVTSVQAFNIRYPVPFSGVAHLMTLSRRKCMHLAASAGALVAVGRPARAQAYPSRPIRVVIGFPVGGTPDILTPIIGQRLHARLGQPIRV